MASKIVLLAVSVAVTFAIYCDLASAQNPLSGLCTDIVKGVSQIESILKQVTNDVCCQAKEVSGALDILFNGKHKICTDAEQVKSFNKVKDEVKEKCKKHCNSATATGISGVLLIAVMVSLFAQKY